MEQIIEYFVGRFEKENHCDLPVTVIDSLKSLNRASRGDLKMRLFNEARKLANHQYGLKAVDWLDKTFYEIEKHSFRYHKVLFSPGNDIPETLSFLLDQAKNKIDLCVFTISDSRLSTKILDAYRRGVDLRIISDDRKSFDRGSQVFSLHKAGVPVKIDHSRYHMHHKFGVIDDKIAFSGSYNWTYTAKEHNQENLIVTTNYDIVHQFLGEFETLWESMFWI
ncbi:MAG: hypothetical protein JW717_06395 [Marinilabiliaceae bacterium]|nr:hypothetical protein [Marinilabiliaceae bacterium]